MAREFAKAFYNSKEWLQCRQGYIKAMPKYKRGLCECCYSKGKHVLGQELHHKIWLTPKNIYDRNITLNHGNLILLCFDCHKEIHQMRKKSQYIINKYGELIPNEKYKPPI
jgi:hypothetical protein|nr:MAG TPA: NinG protein [Caudoviricetes sp.]